MKQEQLKLLAEWYGLKLRGELPFLHITDGIDSATTYWQPHIDSNQLDMLEDRMIVSFPIWQLTIWRNSKDHLYHIWYEYKKQPGGRDEFIKGKGKTKNEAKLNAIISYVEGLK